MSSRVERDVKGGEVLKDAVHDQSTQIIEEEFAVMLSKLLTLLSAKYSTPEELQQLLVKCKRLTLTNETPYVFLIGTEHKIKFNTLSSVRDMFKFFASRWSWCDFDLLKCIVKLSSVAEAKQLLDTYDYMTEWKLAVEEKENGLLDNNQVMSYLFCKMVVVVSGSYDHLSKRQYQDVKKKLLDLGRIQNFSVYFKGEAFGTPLKLFMYIPVKVTENMIRGLQHSKRELSQEGFLFVQVGETVLFDRTGSDASQSGGSQSRASSGDDKTAENLIYRSADHSHALYDLSTSKSFSLVDVDAKVVMLGALSVGKTSITLRYIGNLFSPDVNPTIAASFFSFTVNVGRSKVKFQLWDTAGHERFRSMLPMYYRRANAAIVVYDVTSEESFDQVTVWIKELQKNVSNEVALCIVGNKTDLQGSIKVPTEKGQKLANLFNAAFVESSAKQDIGIHDIFHKTAIQIVDLKQKKLQENLVPASDIHFANLPQPYVVISYRPVATEPSNPITLPPEKPKRKCCPW